MRSITGSLPGCAPGHPWLALAFAAMLPACGGEAEFQPVSQASSFLTLIDVWAFSETDVWFIDGGPTVQRFDGDSFSTLETPALGAVSCIFALSPSDVWLCAGSDVLHYDGATFTPMNVTGDTGLDGLTDIWASSPTDVWAVGDDAIVAHFDGTRWIRESSGATFASSIWGSSPTDVYVLGTFDLVHFDGSVWTPIDLDSGAGDGEVFGTSASDVWVMTDSTELAHFDGAVWQTVDIGDNFIGDLSAVWGLAPDDLWAAGSAGSIAHFDGSSWQEIRHQRIGAPHLQLFHAVHGTSSDDVWAVGNQLGEGGSTGLIFHHGL